MFVVDKNLIKHVKLSTLYTAKWRCRQQIYSQYKFENIVSYYVTYDKLLRNLLYRLSNTLSLTSPCILSSFLSYISRQCHLKMKNSLSLLHVQLE